MERQTKKGELRFVSVGDGAPSQEMAGPILSQPLSAMISDMSQLLVHC